MGLVIMSDRELNHIEVLSQVSQGPMTAVTAANVLGLMQLRFVTSESTFSYFEALDLYLASHGRPVAFHSDKHSAFRVTNRAAKSGHGMTQFGGLRMR